VNAKIVFIAALVLVLGLAAARMLQRHGEQQEREEEARRALARAVDLSALADDPPATKAAEPQKPKLGNKPVIVELAFKVKRGKKLGPFVGSYRVLNHTGQTISDGEVDGSGEPTVMILSPGEYEVQVPKKKFKQVLRVLGHDKQRVTVVIGR
jgi:hypothetical protein